LVFVRKINSSCRRYVLYRVYCQQIPLDEIVRHINSFAPAQCREIQTALHVADWYNKITYFWKRTSTADWDNRAQRCPVGCRESRLGAMLWRDDWPGPPQDYLQHLDTSITTIMHGVNIFHRLPRFLMTFHTTP